MDIFSSMNKAILPGQRVLRIAGWEELKKYPMPRDTEAIFLDEDPSKNYIYMKRVDKNGAEQCARYSFNEDPVEEFDPDKYVKKSDLNAFKEEIINAINSRQSVGSGTTHANAAEHAGSSKSTGSSSNSK